jgi:hypothetical protein
MENARDVEDRKIRIRERMLEIEERVSLARQTAAAQSNGTATAKSGSGEDAYLPDFDEESIANEQPNSASVTGDYEDSMDEQTVF